MTVYQAYRQLAFLLSGRKWPATPGTSNVFARVLTTQAVGMDAQADFRFPMAIIRVGDAQSDEHDPRIKTQRFEVVLAVAHLGDQVGEFAMIGGQRTGLAYSKGRGLLEVEEQLYAVADYLGQTSGLKVQITSSSAAEGALTEEHGYIATRSYILTAEGMNSTRDYPPPNHGKALTSSVALGVVTLSWTLIERFDLHAALTAPQVPARGTLILRRLSGSTAPTTASAGTGVTLSSATATSATDSPGSGTWSYSLFARYDDFGDNSLALTDSTLYASKTVSV